MKQSIQEIRASSKLLFAEESKQTKVNETTPKVVSERLRAFCETLANSRPNFVPVVFDTHGIYGWCSDGVAEKIKSDGGKHGYGWTIWEWPNMFWTAEFHDVWISPDGRLFDITPKPHREPSILFVLDEKFGQDFNFDYRPGNQRQRVYEPIDPMSLVVRRIAEMSLMQRNYEVARARKVGKTLEDWFLSKIVKDPLAAAIDRFLASCKAHETYFDTLAVSGPVRMDRRLQGLIAERVKSQDAFKIELAKHLRQS